ncbi:tectonic-3 isoform X2 [Balaenoptera ricei]|uniref:Tectonic-3 isoform X2 n=1 Tax=Balaenoptera musculus TaxID=9771 RepID=A0A8B8VKD3_BALMU|nr:tectonic-3 isoform X2 [Balaenoptera musculus]XP_059755221.1 tectonic-3 isoform X2 [Balaenoptera ricei]
MFTSQLALLQVFFLMVPEGVRPQPSPSPSGAVSTQSDLGPRTQGETLQSSSEVPGVSTVGPTVVTPSAPGNRTVDLFPVLPICVCDLTPGACDMNCCCDRDCYLLHPRTVFSFCLPGSVRSSSWVCVDNSLIFRSNSPFPSRVFMDSNGIKQFCVHVNNSKLNYFQKLQKVNATSFQALATEFGGESFTSTFQTQSPPPFYRAGDPILTYFPKWSVIGLLRQPAGVGAGGLCAENNPAGFLESKSTTCARFFKNLADSCTLDPTLNAASYHNFTVLKVPRGLSDLQNTKFQVPVTPVSQADSPLLAGNTCQNVVSQVIYEIETNGTFGIQKVSISFGQTNLTVEPGTSFQQHFILHFRAFQQSTAASLTGFRSGNPGYIAEKPLLALTGDRRHSMTLLQSKGDGTCSIKRHEVQFGVNAISGCKLRLKRVDCSHLQQEIYQTLHGSPRPEHVAIFGYALYFLLCHTSFLGDPDIMGICRPPVQPTGSCVRSPIPIPLSAHTGFPTRNRSTFDNCCDLCGHYPEARASKRPTQNGLEIAIRLLLSLQNGIQQRSRLSKGLSLSHSYPVSLTTWSSQPRD